MLFMKWGVVGLFHFADAVVSFSHWSFSVEIPIHLGFFFKKRKSICLYLVFSASERVWRQSSESKTPEATVLGRKL